MPAPLAQIVDQARLMNEEQQKLLWLQLNHESIYSDAAKVDPTSNGKNVSMDEIIKMTRNVRRREKKLNGMNSFCLALQKS